MTPETSPPRRHRSGWARFVLLTLFLLGPSLCAAGDRLNVLMIVIDDLRPELHTYGIDAVSTPNIDAFARRGVRFNNAYCQYPVCNPSRSSFLTGKRPDELGIYNNETPLRQAHPELVTLPQAFRRAGYHTTGLGKLFHKGLDEKGKPTLFRDDASFDHAYRALGKSPAIGREGEGRFAGDGSIPWCRWIAAEGGDEAQPDGMLASEALRLLESAGEEPFFLGVGFHKPHDPFIAPREYFEPYKIGEIALPQAPSDRTPLSRYALPRSYDFSIFTDRDRREIKRAYQACVTFVDAQVGKLLDCLDRRRLWDDTIVIVMGDHGYHLGEHGWWNKVTVFELGARTPMIAWVPGAGGMGKDSDAVVELLDLYPTLIDYCGVEAPHRLSGKSLRPLLEGADTGAGPQAAYTQVTRGGIGMGFSVRTERYRFTQWGRAGEGGFELYEHPADPDEYHNLADDPAYARQIEELTTLLRAGFPSVN
ncbi:Choline-sulfatase [Planctomycetes bacterium MalM25]|nr:Choline-sulfatase [Planctomycetes bacterium MalM25]